MKLLRFLIFLCVWRRFLQQRSRSTPGRSAMPGPRGPRRAPFAGCGGIALRRSKLLVNAAASRIGRRVETPQGVRVLAPQGRQSELICSRHRGRRPNGSRTSVTWSFPRRGSSSRLRVRARRDGSATRRASPRSDMIYLLDARPFRQRRPLDRFDARHGRAGRPQRFLRRHGGDCRG